MNNNYLAISISSIISASSFADSLPLEEITITALFEDQRYDTVATSIAVMSAEELALNQATNLEDSLRTIANLNYSSGSSNARFFQIRGIGERSQFVEPLDPSVGLMVNGMNFSGLGTGVAIADTQQIEVLRGPQGTYYGANALAGMIYVSSASPSDDASAQLHLSADNFSTFSTTGIVNGSISNQVNGRIAINRTQSAGYYENEYLNLDNTQDRDENSLSASLEYLANELLSVKVHLIDVAVDNGYDAFNFDNDYFTQSDQPGFDRQYSTGMSLIIDKSLQDIDIYFTAAAVDSNLAYGYDEDWSYVGYHPWEYSSFDVYYRDQSNANIELRASSKAHKNSWVSGLYLSNKSTDLTREYTYLSSAFTSEYSASTLALFGQYNYEISETSTFEIGARLEQRKSDYTDSDSINGTPDETMWGLRLAYNILIHEHLNGYALLSRGYKAGGFNSNIELPIDLRSYDTETLWNYELGVKARLDQAFNYAIALFYQQRDDAQIKGSRLVERDDGSTQFIDYIDNSAKGFNTGIELDINYLINDSFSSFARLGYLLTELEESGATYDGREQAHAPNYTYTIGLDWLGKGGFYGRASIEGKDSFFFSDRHDEKSESYALINGTLGWRSNHYDLSIWIKNATNESPETRGFGSFGNDPANGYETEPYYQLGAPRQYGISFKTVW